MPNRDMHSPWLLALVLAAGNADAACRRFTVHRLRHGAWKAPTWPEGGAALAQVITVPNWEWHALSAAAPAKDAAAYKAQRDAKRAAYLIRLLDEAGIAGIEAGPLEVEGGGDELEAGADREEAGAGGR